MSRWISTNNANYAAGTQILMVTLADLGFDGAPIFVSDGFGQIIANGTIYSGLGDYGTIDVVEETTESISKPLMLSLSGVPNALLTDVVTTNCQGRLVTLWIALIDINSGKLIDTPEVSWQGRMDYTTVEISPNSSKINLHCENRLNREPLVARYTDQDQQIAFPGDTFFDLVWQIPLSQAGWGAVTVQYPANVPPNRGLGTVGGRYGGSGGKTP